MLADQTIRGKVHQFDRPVWEPLVALFGEDLAGWFMWMCEIELEDQSPLHSYKHSATRSYLYLTEDGRAFVYQSDESYEEIPVGRAVFLAHAGWERLLPPPPRLCA